MIQLVHSGKINICFIARGPASLPGTVLDRLNGGVRRTLQTFAPGRRGAIGTITRAFHRRRKRRLRGGLARLGINRTLISFLSPRKVPNCIRRIVVCPPRDGVNVLSPLMGRRGVGHSLLCCGCDRTVSERSSCRRLRQLSRVGTVRLRRGRRLTTESERGTRRLGRLRVRRRGRGRRARRGQADDSHSSAVSEFAGGLVSRMNERIKHIVSHNVLNVLGG